MTDTTPRDQLAELVAKSPVNDEGDTLDDSYWDVMPKAEMIADAILAAGWRPPDRVRHLGQRVTDPDVEATYVTLTMVSRVGNTVEFEGQTILDLDPDGHLIGVELIGPVEPKED